MATGYLFIGFLFLINPDYFTFDILPDVFGYLLIARGLYRLSFLEDRIWQARRSARTLAGISLVKLITNLIAMTTNVESTRLTLMFVFAAAEGFLGYVLADHLFKGIQYLAVRQNSDLALKGIDVAGFFVKAFFIAKNVLSFLPASLILFFSDVDADPELVEGYASLRRSYISTRTVLMAICFIGIFAFGIYTAVVIRAYLKRVRSDAGFSNRLAELYREKVTDNPDAMTRIHVRESFGFFLAAVLFLPDIYVDHLGLIPTFLAGILAYIGLRNLSKGVDMPPLLKRIVLGALIASFASYVYRLVCLILWEEKFQMRFWGSTASFVAGIGGGIASLAILGSILWAMIRVCRRETEVPYRVSAVFTALLWIGTVGCAVFGYIYPGRNGVVQAIQIGLTLVALYLFWRKSDQITAEVDYRRM